MRVRNLQWARISLAARVTFLVGVVFVCCVVMLGLVVQGSINRHFIEQDADELRVIAVAVSRAILDVNASKARDDFQERLEQAVSGHHGVYFGVYDSAGRKLYSMPGPDLSKLAQSLTPVEKISIYDLHEWIEGDSTFRGTVVNVPDEKSQKFGGYKIVVASSMNFHLQFMRKFQETLWAILACANVMILLTVWFAVQFAHRPLHKISQEIGNITTEKLNLRLDPNDVPVDLRELASSFNEMIGRIDEVFQRLSNFSADIAHELRTPITNLTTQTQVALSKERQSEEYREVLYSNLEEYERMATMVNDMLWLAQSDNGMLKPAFEPVDPATQISELFDYLGAWAEDRNISLSLEGSCPQIVGDKAMLRRALTNLLTNAIHHTDTGTSIRVRLGTDIKYAQIIIENQGDDIPSELMPRIFNRFYRVDPSRQRASSGGRAGLGLAIVRSIVDIHGGQITVTSEQRKTEFTISLPLSTPA